MGKVNWTALLNWGSIFANIITLLFLILKFIPSLGDDTTSILVVSFLGIALMVALLVNAIMFYHWQGEKSAIANEKELEINALKEEIKSLSRNSKYASVFKLVNAGFSPIHKLIRDNETSEKEYIRVFTKFCDLLSNVFTQIVGEQCSVCIKGLGEEDDDSIGELDESAGTSKEQNIEYLFAATLFRDTNSSVERDQLSKDHADVIHWYVRNTDFAILYKNINGANGRYWFCNNLPKLDKYSNTSFLYYDGFQINGFPGVVSYDEKLEKWPLEYKATITVPICPSINQDRNVDKIAGFLCVDVGRIDIFEEAVDPQLLIGCADGMFNALAKFVDLSK